MPGIDFTQVRARIPLADVLDLIGFVPGETSGNQVRGPCPVHHSTAPSSRSFSANLRLYIDRCFKCGSSGNQSDPYASVTGLSLFDAAVVLCEQLHREIPRMIKATQFGSQPITSLHSHGTGASQSDRLAQSLAAADRPRSDGSRRNR
jgi:DNA primase